MWTFQGDICRQLPWECLNFLAVLAKLPETNMNMNNVWVMKAAWSAASADETFNCYCQVCKWHSLLLSASANLGGCIDCTGSINIKCFTCYAWSAWMWAQIIDMYINVAIIFTLDEIQEMYILSRPLSFLSGVSQNQQIVVHYPYFQGGHKTNKFELAWNCIL